MRRRRRDYPPRRGEGDRPEDGGGGGVPRADPPPSALRAATSPSWGGTQMTALFPTRKQEEWRYADLDALRPVWEQFAGPVTLTVGPGESFEKIWLPGDEAVQVRRVQIALEKGAKARLFVLSTASEYGRTELEVS